MKSHSNGDFFFYLFSIFIKDGNRGIGFDIFIPFHLSLSFEFSSSPPEGHLSRNKSIAYMNDRNPYILTQAIKVIVTHVKEINLTICGTLLSLLSMNFFSVSKKQRGNFINKNVAQFTLKNVPHLLFKL